jgi:FkbM family methyltransferase
MTTTENFSDNGVDKYLESAGLPAFGYACEVGANTGIIGSNTMLFQHRGWLTLCVEPNPKLEEEGRNARQLWRQVACGAIDEEARELIVAGGYPWASHTGLEMRYGYDGATEKVVVKVRTLDRLLEEAGFPRVDLLCIDTEGYEAEVMQGFTPERWKPMFIARPSIPRCRPPC